MDRARAMLRLPKSSGPAAPDGREQLPVSSAKREQLRATKHFGSDRGEEDEEGELAGLRESAARVRAGQPFIRRPFSQSRPKRAC